MRAQGRWLFGKQFPIAAVVCLTFLSSRSHAHTLTLAWDPNPEPEVAGYIVYVGTEPGIYAEQFDVGVRAVRPNLFNEILEANHEIRCLSIILT